MLFDMYNNIILDKCLSQLLLKNNVGGDLFTSKATFGHSFLLLLIILLNAYDKLLYNIPFPLTPLNIIYYI